jgi:Fe-S-cluster containining protein
MDRPLDHNITGHSSFIKGAGMLERPVWPLANLFLMLYLTGPYDTPEALAADLPETIDAGGCEYENPARILSFVSELLFPVASMLRDREYGDDYAKVVQERLGRILNPDGTPPDFFDGLSALCQHDIISRELEEINSLLCGPCGCDICCVGPVDNAVHDFFEIPLNDDETALFDIAVIDSDASRSALSADEPPLVLQHGAPFYRSETPLLIHWKDGWSLVMTRMSSCPHLCDEGCMIYPKRPSVCRKPQIFSFVLEEENGTYIIRNALLAVWDCPYVRHLKDVIARYATLNDLELFFRENKA